MTKLVTQKSNWPGRKGQFMVASSPLVLVVQWLGQEYLDMPPQIGAALGMCVVLFVGWAVRSRENDWSPEREKPPQGGPHSGV